MAASHHGHTPAAWTAVIIIFLGICVSGVFTVMAEPLGFVAGLVVALIGAVVGGVMSAMGLGQRPAQPQKAASGSAEDQQGAASVEG